ncbi:MAG: hypothetical protein J7M38_07305 [Armatimonadetes bacterium]|nr:hypothetical protein [Armatimonadota bacterium]
MSEENTETVETEEPEQQPASHHRKRIPGFCSGCLLGGLLTLVLLTAAAVMVRREPDAYPGLVRAIFGAGGAGNHSLTGPTLSMQQLQAIRGVKPNFSIVLSEADINVYLKEHPDALGLPKGYAAPRVRFTHGQMRLSVRTRVLLWPVRVEVWLQPAVMDNRFTTKVVKVRAGRVSLPGEFRAQIEQQASRLLNEQLAGAGVVPLAVEVGEGRLTVTAQLQPIAP